MIELLIFCLGVLWCAGAAILWRDLIAPDGLLEKLGAALAAWKSPLRLTLGLCPPCFSVCPTIVWTAAMSVTCDFGFFATIGTFALTFPLVYPLTAWINGRI